MFSSQKIASESNYHFILVVPILLTHTSHITNNKMHFFMQLMSCLSHVKHHTSTSMTQIIFIITIITYYHKTTLVTNMWSKSRNNNNDTHLCIIICGEYVAQILTRTKNIFLTYRISVILVCCWCFCIIFSLQCDTIRCNEVMQVHLWEFCMGIYWICSIGNVSPIFCVKEEDCDPNTRRKG